METISTTGESMVQRNDEITESVRRERTRLWAFIRKRIADPSEAEDILQDVLFEFVEAYHQAMQIEQVGAWLFRVARNRIIRRFRKKMEVLIAERLGDEADDYWLAAPEPPVEGPET